jgi:hypothetical protein
VLNIAELFKSDGLITPFVPNVGTANRYLGTVTKQTGKSFAVIVCGVMPYREAYPVSGPLFANWAVNNQDTKKYCNIWSVKRSSVKGLRKHLLKFSQ